MMTNLADSSNSEEVPNELYEHKKRHWGITESYGLISASETMTLADASQSWTPELMKAKELWKNLQVPLQGGMIWM